MSGPKFFETRMGQHFYEGTMPRLVKALESLATSADRLADGADAELVAAIDALRPETGDPTGGPNAATWGQGFNDALTEVLALLKKHGRRS